MNISSASYKTRGNALPHVAVLLLIMVYTGMSVMFLLIWLGVNTFITLAAFIGSMVFIMALFSGETEYVIDTNGVQKNLVTWLFKRVVKKSFKWAEIKSYKNGKDLNRSLEEYEFLEITFKNSETWQILDSRNVADFQIFRDSFFAAVKIFNEEIPAPETILNLPHEPKTDKSARQFQPARSIPVQVEKKTEANTQRPHIERSKTFYETFAAKVVFWIFAAFFSALAGFLIKNPEYLKASYLIRFGIIIVPGMLYFAGKIYRKKK